MCMLKGCISYCSISGLTFNSILFGLGLSITRQRGRILFTVFDAVFQVLLQILLAALWSVS